MPKIEIICNQCDNIHYRWKCLAYRYVNQFCSRKCSGEHRRDTTSFTPEDIEYVRLNFLSKPLADIAAHIGSTAVSLERYISKWRKEGYDIPKKTTRTPVPVKPRKQRAKVKVLPRAEKKQSALPVHKPEPVLKTPKPLTGGRYVRIDSRTLIYRYD